MEKMNLLVVTANTGIDAGVGYDAFMSTTFRPVRDVMPNGTPIFSSPNSGTRAFNIGKEPGVGEFFAGSLVTADTTDYEIDGKIVRKTTAIVFDGEDSLAVLNKSLFRKGVQIASVLVNGKPSIDLTPKAAPKAETPALDPAPIGG